MPEFALQNFKENLRSASVSALNKLGARIKTRISTALREKYNLKKAEVDKYIFIKKANAKNMTIEITAGTKKIGLDHFGKVTKGTSGVKVQIIKGKEVEIRVHPTITEETGHGKAFFTGKNNQNLVIHDSNRIGTFTAKRAVGLLTNVGDIAVFARKGNDRYPLRRVVGPSIADLASSKMIEVVIQKTYDEDFSKLLEHEIKYYTTRNGQ